MASWYVVLLKMPVLEGERARTETTISSRATAPFGAYHQQTHLTPRTAKTTVMARKMDTCARQPR